MDFKTRVESAGFHVSVITDKDMIKTERLRKLFDISENILFVARKI
jgi:hypothetical protein